MTQRSEKIHKVRTSSECVESEVKGPCSGCAASCSSSTFIGPPQPPHQACLSKHQGRRRQLVVNGLTKLPRLPPAARGQWRNDQSRSGEKGSEGSWAREGMDGRDGRTTASTQWSRDKRHLRVVIYARQTNEEDKSWQMHDMVRCSLTDR